VEGTLALALTLGLLVVLIIITAYRLSRARRPIPGAAASWLLTVSAVVTGSAVFAALSEGASTRVIIGVIVGLVLMAASLPRSSGR
jgi:hypothetical protein